MLRLGRCALATEYLVTEYKVSQSLSPRIIERGGSPALLIQPIMTESLRAFSRGV
jgi:hypothetical protein